MATRRSSSSVRTIDVLPLAKRLKALDLSDKEAIIANYDPKSDEFKDIAARSEETDSNCMYGTSFLVFERTTGRFLELFFGTKSARPIAGDLAVYLALSQADIDRKAAAGADVSQMKPHGPQPCTLKARLAKNKRGHSWHVPDVQECSTPFSNKKKKKKKKKTGIVVDEGWDCSAASFINFFMISSIRQILTTIGIPLRYREERQTHGRIEASADHVSAGTQGQVAGGKPG